MNSKSPSVKVAIVGLGYVGLPLAIELGKTHYAPVIGFDVLASRIQELHKGHDKNNDSSKAELDASKIDFTHDPSDLRQADFIIVAVPTPVTKAKVPDFSFLESASRIVGENLKKDAIVVFESTVYPGATEEICVPIIEKYSGLQCGRDWKIGYSPERINPGDRKHNLSNVVKIVSGMDKISLDVISDVYRSVSHAGIFQASSIRVAEAAKVIENVQRDLNIALVNELSLIFHRMNIPTREVLEAAGTKWNFHKYRPGLVGGHCIGVDPYYLTYKAEQIGYHPQLILAGRRVNDSMASYVAAMSISALFDLGRNFSSLKASVLGLTFKENVADTRNSKVKDLISEFKKHQIDVYGFDPLITPEKIKNEFGIHPVSSLSELPPSDIVVLLVPHDFFKEQPISNILSVMQKQAVMFDIPGMLHDTFPRENDQYVYLTL